MTFLEYFDINDFGHIQAYAFLRETGQWPESFPYRKLEFDTNWQIMICFRMANAWIEYMLAHSVRMDNHVVGGDLGDCLLCGEVIER